LLCHGVIARSAAFAADLFAIGGEICAENLRFGPLIPKPADGNEASD
jgi:hypothetical protein